MMIYLRNVFFIMLRLHLNYTQIVFILYLHVCGRVASFLVFCTIVCAGLGTPFLWVFFIFLFCTGAFLWCSALLFFY